MDARQLELLGAIDLKKLGRRVRSARVSARMTQAALAGDDVSVGYVSRIEAGQRRPNPQVLTMFATRLGTSAEELLSGVPPRTLDQVRLTLDYAELSLESGEAAEAKAHAEQALALAETSGLEDMALRARHLHARAMEGLGRLDDAILELEPLVAELPGILRAEAGIALCRCYRESGDLTKAVETGERTLEDLAEIGLDNGDEAVRMSVTLAAAYFERGDTGQAVRTCRKAVTKAEALDSPVARASAYWNTSIVESERGSIENAAQLAERALALLGEGRDARNLAILRSHLGEMQLSQDPPRIEEAQQNLREAAEGLAWSSAGAAEIARNSVVLARALLLGGDVSAALELSMEVHDSMQEQAPIAAADAKTLEGQAWAAQGRTDEAAQAFRRAVQLLTGIGSDREAGQLWYDLAGLLEDVGDLEAARQAYRSAAAASGLRSRSVRVGSLTG